MKSKVKTNVNLLLICIGIFIKNEVKSQDTVFIDKKAKHIVVTEFNGNKNIESKRYFIGKNQYKYELYSESGKLIETSCIDSVSGFALFEEKYYGNGKIKSSWIGYGVAIIKDESDTDGERELMVLDGYRVRYYENGNKEEEYTIIGGKLNGLKSSYYKNGKIKEERHYYNGQPLDFLKSFDINENHLKTDSLFKSLTFQKWSYSKIE